MSFESTLILCSTPRLAHSLQIAHQQKNIQAGLRQWQAPAIYTVGEWLSTTIETAILCGEIVAENNPNNALTSTQEGLLWEQSIAHHLQKHDAADLFDTAGLANAAIEANRFFTEWRLTLDTQNTSDETQQFLLWRAHFQMLCKQANVLEAVRYEDWQITRLAEGAGQLPAKIQLAGFDRIHPNMARLIQTLNKRGVTVSDYPTTLEKPGEVRYTLCNDQDEECRRAVAWAQEQLNKNPDTRIAIVTPALDTLRTKLSALLDDTFHPQSAAPAYADVLRCYDFTLGVPLSSLPIINTALNLLRFAWQKQAIMQMDIANLVNSAYWSASLTEANSRAKLDAHMRQRLPLSIKNYRLLHFIAHATDGEQALHLTALYNDLDQLLGIAQANSREQSAATWAEVFSSALQATNWPGERQLSSHEYQAVQSFERVLQQLVSLEGLVGNISANEAIKRLTQLCKAQIFQPERKTAPNIQIMGMLEAAAEPLDAIWVMGMNDHIWPPIARHNALLPADIQRQVKTPNASSEVQATFANTIHQRLIHSAPQVIFSSASKDGERQLRTSPLMQGIAHLTTSPLPAKTLAEDLASQNTHDWQWLDDYQAPPIQQGEHVSGGTSLLKAQAICPAWAYYQYRLHVRKLGEPVNGLDAMERGNLVHAVLATYWQHHDLSKLQNTKTETLLQTLTTIATETLARFNLEREGVFSDKFIALETVRLSKLVFTWLTDVEMLRPQDFSVSACEQEHLIDIEGITIRLIIDRVDTLTDGRLVVIDYKTGRLPDYKNWAETNITEPQLPIYAAFVLQDNEIAAICFAGVKTAEHQFIGISASQDIVQGVEVLDVGRIKAGRTFPEALFPSWKSVIQHWRAQITATALSLKSGNASVQFDDEKRLAYCDVIPLLRLPERQLQFEKHHQE